MSEIWKKSFSDGSRNETTSITHDIPATIDRRKYNLNLKVVKLKAVMEISAI